MNSLIFEGATLAGYVLTFFASLRYLQKANEHPVWLKSLLGLVVILHGYSVYLNIDSGQGQNLSLFNMFAMTTWVAMLVIGWNILRHRAWSLLLVSLPVSAMSIAELMLFKGESPLQLSGKWGDLAHIFSGIFAMSLMLLASLQAALVLYLDHGLRHRPATIHQWLGPLDSMERFLIQLLTLGFVAMTLTFILVLNLPDTDKATQPLHKIVLTFLSWLVFAGLLFGRYVRGWRGVFAARWTIVGSLLLLLGYFGSKLVLEYFIH